MRFDNVWAKTALNVGGNNLGEFAVKIPQTPEERCGIWSVHKEGVMRIVLYDVLSLFPPGDVT